MSESFKIKFAFDPEIVLTLADATSGVKLILGDLTEAGINYQLKEVALDRGVIDVTLLVGKDDFGIAQTIISNSVRTSYPQTKLVLFAR